MKIEDSTLADIQADPIPGTIRLVDNVYFQLKEFAGQQGWSPTEHLILVEAAALVEELLESGIVDVKVKPLGEISGDIQSDCAAASEFLSEVRDCCKGRNAKSQYESLRTRFKVALSNRFAYEFSAGDLQRVQDLINELREQLTVAQGLEETHRQRLMRRLEKLQAELHKKMSDLDRFWGLIGDAGVVLGKLGTDAKPIVDRIRDIADIVWQTQSRAEELPSGTKPPLIEHEPPSE